MLEILRGLFFKEKELINSLQTHLESYDVTQALENQTAWQGQALQIHAELQAVYQRELNLFSELSDEMLREFIISLNPEMDEAQHDEVLLLWNQWKLKLNTSVENPEDAALFYFFSLKLLLIPTGRELFRVLLDELLKPENQLILQIGNSWGVPRPTKTGVATLNYPITCLQKTLSIFPRLMLGNDEKAPLTFDVPYVTFGHELIHVLHQWQGTDARKLAFPHGFFSPKFHLYNRKIFADSEELQTIEDENYRKICENKLREDLELAKRAGHISACIDNPERLSWLILAAHARAKESASSRNSMRIIYTPAWKGIEGKLHADIAATWQVPTSEKVAATSVKALSS